MECEKFWGVKASPLMAPDWQGALLKALQEAADALSEERAIDALITKVNRHARRVVT
jgi:hypothetical protein